MFSSAVRRRIEFAIWHRDNREQVDGN